VSGVPLYIDNPGVPAKDSKIMPLVLLVPSGRGSYPGYSWSLTFVSVVKTIMSISFFAQAKPTKLISAEQM
jgi:hypothetical protein